MSKPKFITINVPEPCDESWEEMRPHGCGRFCAHCEKTVIDFTQMTDEAVVKVLMNNSGSSCGRFNDEQLNRQLLIPDARPARFLPHLFSKVAASLLLMQTLVNNAFAQKKEATYTEQAAPALAAENAHVLILEGTLKDYIDEGQREMFTNLQKDSNIVTSQGVRNFIDGFEPHLTGMEISVSGLNYIKYTDRDGYFRFVLPDSFRGKKLIVTAKYQPTSSPEKAGTTLRPEEVIFGDNENIKTIQLFRYKVQQLNSVKIEAFYPQVTSGTSGIIYQYIERKPTFWQKVKRIFKKKNH